MSRPGVEVTIRDSTPPRSAPVGIDVWFVVGVSEKGPDEAAQARSMGEFQSTFGARVPTSVLYDSAEAFFREGGSRMVVSRVFGPSPVKASVTLADDTPAPTIKVEALGAGDYGDDLSVQVIAGVALNTVSLIIYDGADVVETSMDLATKQEVIDWGANSDYVRTSSAGASTELPAVAAKTALTGGTDDGAAATATDVEAALDRLTSDWGPGQVSAPGYSTTNIQAAVLAHAASHNRVALLDPAVVSDANALATMGQTLRNNANARYGALFAPWAQVPGLADGTIRQVPFSAIQAALMARVPAANVPAAGENGQARYAIGLTNIFTDDERESLMEDGVNTARMIYGGVRSYGYRTLADPVTLKNWLGLNGLRLIMDIKNQAEIIAERYVFRQIDGQGAAIGAFNGALTGMLLNYYNSGQLFGATFEDSCFVDTGDAVNTPVTIANQEIHALIGVKTSPFGELVAIEIVKVGLTEVLAV
jgi:hypothetical protein